MNGLPTSGHPIARSGRASLTTVGPVRPAEGTADASGRAPERRIAVILYADAVGYSLRTRADETGTHRALTERFDLFQQVFARHGGKIVDHPGDAVLAEFSTVSGAIEGAVEAQRRLGGPATGDAHPPALAFRMGINLGDVIIDRGNVYGDGVNLAERIQRIAPPGGVCVSEAVYAVVRNAPDHRFRFYGEHALKNIETLVKVYHLADTPAQTGGQGDIEDQTFVAVACFRAVNLDRIMARLDIEHIRDLGNFHRRALRTVATDHGGALVSEAVDRYVLAFRSESGRDDTIGRAVAAAEQICRTTELSFPGLVAPLAWTVGIESGLALIEHDSAVAAPVVHGAVMLQATILAQHTEPAILIGENAYAAVRDVYECGPLVVEAGRRPAAWIVRARHSDGRAMPAPFVGRRVEISQLSGILAATVSMRRGALIRICGEAGIGKTRLAEEFSRSAGLLGFDLRRVEIDSFGDYAKHRTVEVLTRGLLGLGASSSAAECEQAVRTAEAAGMTTGEESAFLRDALNLEATPETRARFASGAKPDRSDLVQAAIFALLTRKARRRPLILIVDDFHAADHRDVQLVQHLARATEEVPFVLLIVTRAEDAEADTRWRRLQAGGSALDLRLGPLRADEANEIAASLDIAENLPIGDCVARARGNPFFLIQLLRHMTSAGDSALPLTIMGLIKARLETLPRRERASLQAIAVAGQRTTIEMLRFLLDAPDYEPRHLVDRGLVVVAGDGITLDHGLIREVAYSSTPLSRRQHLHRRAAAWHAGRDPVLHAEHLLAAGDPSAPAALAGAAAQELQRFRSSEALGLIERGLAGECRASDRFDLLYLKGKVLYALGLVASSTHALTQAVEAAAADRQRARAWLALAMSLVVLDHYGDAMAHLDLAEEAAEREGLVEEIAQVHCVRGSIQFPLGRVEDCARQHARALELARSVGAVQIEAKALSGLGDARYAQGRMKSAHAVFTACVELSSSEGSMAIVAENRHMIASSLHYFAPLPDALAEARAALEAATRIGHRRAELCCHSCLSVILFDLQRFHEVEHHVDMGQRLAHQLGARRFEPLNLTLLAKVRRMAGERAEAAALVAEALAISREVGMSYNGPRVLGELALIDDEPQAQRAAVDEALALLSAGCIASNHLWFYRDAMEHAVITQDFAAALRFADAMAAYTAPEPLAWADLHHAWCRLVVAARTGQAANAREEAESLLAPAREQGYARIVDEVEQILAA